MLSNFDQTDIDELARDPDFQRWILAPTREDHIRWHRVLKYDPAKFQLFEEAKRLVLMSHFLADESIGQNKWQIHDNLMESARRDRKSAGRRLLMAGIAALFLVSGFSWIYFFSHKKIIPVSFQANYGERKQVQLPDGSKVELNANSMLTMGSEWEAGSREVWLEGEAFFNVLKKDNTGEKFTVHTDVLDIEVLGTSFNVNKREGEIIIYLEEGSIKLLVGKENTEVLMVPGQLARYSKAGLEVIEAPLKVAESMVSWKDGYLIYDSTPLKVLMQDILINYGKKVVVQDITLLEKRISGALPLDNLDEFIRVTELIFDLKATIGTDQIYLERKPLNNL